MTIRERERVESDVVRSVPPAEGRPPSAPVRRSRLGPRGRQSSLVTLNRSLPRPPRLLVGGVQGQQRAGAEGRAVGHAQVGEEPRGGPHAGQVHAAQRRRQRRGQRGHDGGAARQPLPAARRRLQRHARRPRGPRPRQQRAADAAALFSGQWPPFAPSTGAYVICPGGICTDDLGS